MKLRFVLRASIATFGTYFCMYAFRKPFSVATFSDQNFWGIDYKILLIIVQLVGYTSSKFLGIKIVSEMRRSRRIVYLISFIAFAELALLGFALTPAPYNMIFLFLNGLPLGMIFGIVFSYIEGRKTTELLGVVLCSSFIVSSGIVKSVGKWVMDSLHFSEFWMPFITGLFFVLPLLFFAYLLEKLPPPTIEEQLLKTARKPLDNRGRKIIFKKFAIPLILLSLFCVILTIVRDFRDNFTREIWDSLGYKGAAIYSISEIPIAIIALILFVILGNVVKNYKAFIYYHYVLFIGCLLVGISTFLFQLNIFSPLAWMIISGLGLYIGFIPFQGLLFDRMIAVFKIKGNVGFLIYVVDSFSYLGAVIVLLYKNFGGQTVSWMSFLIEILYFSAFAGMGITLYSFLFFRNKYRTNKSVEQSNLISETVEI